MRNGPEIRITGNVTTVNADTSVVVTEQREESMDKNLQSAARVVTITQALTAGWVVGEKVEVLTAEVARLNELLEPGKAPRIVDGLFRLAQEHGLSPYAAEHPLSYITKLLTRVRALEEALNGVQKILAEPGTPPKSVWYAWQEEFDAALTPPRPPAATMLGVPISEAERDRISKDGA
ncbi:MAG TPA: hypothetical protein VKA83_09125 [Methylomirabilota bacterium]|nr:hypothetical protein [Methylomirabilota bacterium]